MTKKITVTPAEAFERAQRAAPGLTEEAFLAQLYDLLTNEAITASAYARKFVEVDQGDFGSAPQDATNPNRRDNRYYPEDAKAAQDAKIGIASLLACCSKVRVMSAAKLFGEALLPGVENNDRRKALEAAIQNAFVNREKISAKNAAKFLRGAYDEAVVVTVFEWLGVEFAAVEDCDPADDADRKTGKKTNTGSAPPFPRTGTIASRRRPSRPRSENTSTTQSR